MLHVSCCTFVLLQEIKEKWQEPELPDLAQKSQMFPDPPFCAFSFFRFLCFFGVNSTHAFFVVTMAVGGSKKRSFDEKSVC